MKRLARLLFLLVFPLLATQVFAREYIVEAIIFSYQQNAATSPGGWDPNSERIKTRQSRLLRSFSRARLPNNPQALSNLAKVRNTLARSAEYRVLKSLSWQQSENNFKRSPLIKIQATGLVGAIKVYAPNLLFTEINLQYTPLLAIDNPANHLPKYYLNEKRKLKLNEIHYFDHPKVGVVLRVSPKDQ